MSTLKTTNIAHPSSASNNIVLDSSGRLLVGTSSALTGSNSQYSKLVSLGNSLNTGGSYVAFGLGQVGTSLGAGVDVATINFTDNAAGQFASIACFTDAACGAGDYPGRLVISTCPDGSATPVERMRITQAGHVGIGVTPTYRFDVAASAGNSYIGFHENTANTADDNLYLWRMGANANSASANFLYCQTSTTQRFGLRGNGGLANFQANNVNLSDRNAKKDISPAADTWECIKEWEIVNYRYKDQPDDADLNLGVIAQQVAESCPEVITVFQEATEDEPEKLGVKEQQMYWMAIKALQEAQLRIEALEAEVAALKAA